MRRSQLSRTLGALGITVLFLSLPVWGAITEPTPEPAYRSLRDDPNREYVTNWYIFNDDQNNGILDPGDTYIDEFKNWWVPVSAHTQHNYLRRGQATNEDWSSGPMNFNSKTNHLDNYWLDREANAMYFYLSYSQFDNNDWKGGGYTDGKTGDTLDILKDRNGYRNGYYMGWLTHDISDGDKTTEVGQVKMDVYIHKGQMDTTVGGNWSGATSYSNPQVATSNDIGNAALDNVGATGQWQAPQFDDSGAAGTGTYDWGGATENKLRMEANGHNQTAFNTMVDSMEVKEWDRVHGTWGAEAVLPGMTPAQIEANEVDDANAAYIYEDSFRDRCVVHEGATDGGVIAGLSGYDNYDYGDNNWGDQQVIRMDFDDFTSTTTANTGIDKIVWWDFGDSDSTTWGQPGVPQVTPSAIVFGIDRTRSVADGQIYIDGATGRTYFPDNIVYIARVHIPEPATLALIAMGGTGLILRRRRHADTEALKHRSRQGPRT